ncbi:hypothetical protein RRG08_010290 [Elysia crispata]|uniref:Uncharacterized protein n=1 Tax=Elysia crispata TaxID=231223 RepID=A0AAE1D8U5_9GAST|nr:hypothetical protein RRG08_010290 [Elysia crispata]
MIKRGLILLQDKFTSAVGGGKRVAAATHDVTSAEDLSTLEVFYASTSTADVSSASGSGGDNGDNMTYVMDASMDVGPSEAEKSRIQAIEEMRAAKEMRANQKRENMKKYIDSLAQGDDQLQPLSRVLHRSVRERATLAKLSNLTSVEREGDDDDDREESGDGIGLERTKTKPGMVYYVSSSFIVDGVYPMYQGIHKRWVVRKLREKYMTRLRELDGPMRWFMLDSNKSIVPTVFEPVFASSLYEDNLQRLLLPAAFRMRDTHKLNPRGAIVAYMALMALDHDPIVDISGKHPTTLRGLFHNILDGSIYEGHFVSSMLEPQQIDNAHEGSQGLESRTATRQPLRQELRVRSSHHQATQERSTVRREKWSVDVSEQEEATVLRDGLQKLD